MTPNAPREGGPLANPWLRRFLIFLFWTVMGLLNAASAVSDNLEKDPDHPIWKPIVWEMSSLYTIGALCPLLVWLTYRFPFERASWRRSLAAHLAAMPVFSLLHTGGMVLLRMAAYAVVGQSYQFAGPDSLMEELFYEFSKDVSLYWIIVCLTLGFRFFQKYRERELRASQLETRLARAKLANLEGRLNPHFLFNTLNLISSTMYEDVKRADRLIMQLSDLLRLSLERADRGLIRLRDELDFLHAYMDIIQTRFADRLTATIEAEPAAMDALVPNLILQPLVENAVKHGLADLPAGGRIEATAAVAGDRLILKVRDNGPGLPPAFSLAENEGLGLGATAARLQGIYGDEARLDLRRPDGGGLEAIVDLPYRLTEEEGGHAARADR